MSNRTVTMKGNPLNLLGNNVQPGDMAPDFNVSAADLSEVSSSILKDKVTIISVVPSIDTPVCDRETRRFNVEAAKLGDEVQVLTISMDLPFAQARWCGAAGIKNVQLLSDYKAASFGNNYGVLIDGLHLLARAVFIIDKSSKVQYVQVVPEVTDEPNYDEVLKAVKELV